MAVTAMPQARMTEAEWRTRVDLAACYRLVDLFGWSDLINTRITARVPNSSDRGPHEHFLINRFGMLYDEITASSLIKIDSDGNNVEPSDEPVNRGGFAIPGTIHRARPDIACVIHTHTIAGGAVSMQKNGLLPLNQHALQVIGDIAYHDYEGTGRSDGERARFLADFGEKHIMVLRNHGLFVIGRTIAEAFIATYRMERACAMQLAFQQSGAELNPLSDAVIEAGFAKSKGGAARGHDPNTLDWPALLRKLDRIDPSYKE
jgi:ribulose-5-phosphate 4-epimerase/fuculose-1-phosphate aldolase